MKKKLQKNPKIPKKLINSKTNSQNEENKALKVKHKRKKYKKRNPLYFYYQLGGYTFKYTCKK